MSLGLEVSPKANNELVGPQQPKEVVDEGVLQILVPLECIAAVGVISALGHLSSCAALHCTYSSSPSVMDTPASWAQVLAG